MDNKIQNNNSEILNTYRKSKKDNLPFEFSFNEKMYNQTVEKLNKSDLSNSSSRYLSELAQVKNLKELAQRFNLKDKLNQYSELEEEIINKLKHFGFNVK